MPCEDCVNMKVELLSLKEFINQWFKVIMKKQDKLDNQNLILTQKLSRQEVTLLQIRKATFEPDPQPKPLPVQLSTNTRNPKFLNLKEDNIHAGIHAAAICEEEDEDDGDGDGRDDSETPTVMEQDSTKNSLRDEADAELSLGSFLNTFIPENEDKNEECDGGGREDGSNASSSCFENPSKLTQDSSSQSKLHKYMDEIKHEYDNETSTSYGATSSIISTEELNPDPLAGLFSTETRTENTNTKKLFLGNPRQRLRLCRKQLISCRICKKPVSHTPTSMEYHARTHTGIKCYKCRFCETQCYRRDNIISHMRNVHHVDKDEPVLTMGKLEYRKVVDSMKQACFK